MSSAVDRAAMAEISARSAEAVLRTFERWPTWMWANTEVVVLMDWMRRHNHETGATVGFHGLDVYSLWDSLRIVMDHVREHDPDAVEAAEAAWRCFEPYGEDPQRYARATRLVPEACEDEVVELLVSLRDGRNDTPDAREDAADETRDDRPGGAGESEEEFLIRQNAEVVAGAERYYRTMVRADGESWNVRDHHMMDTLDRLLDHHGSGSRAIVWAHNTHVGDARATDMVAHGMVNLGQLGRERHGDDVVLVGFGGHSGTVLAGSSWGSPMRVMEVPAPPGGTHEDLLHRRIGGDALFVFDDDRRWPWLSDRRGHRAIGVVYDPGRDRFGNWVPTVMGERYDAFLFFDRTTHLEPITPTRISAEGELDTAPWAS